MSTQVDVAAIRASQARLGWSPFSPDKEEIPMRFQLIEKLAVAVMAAAAVGGIAASALAQGPFPRFCQGQCNGVVVYCSSAQDYCCCDPTGTQAWTCSCMFSEDCLADPHCNGGLPINPGL